LQDADVMDSFFAAEKGAETASIFGALSADPSVPSPSLSFGTTTPNGIIDLGRYRGVYGTTFV